MISIFKPSAQARAIVGRTFEFSSRQEVFASATARRFNRHNVMSTSVKIIGPVAVSEVQSPVAEYQFFSIITGHSQEIPAGSEVDLTGTDPGTGFQRKATIITNLDRAVDLNVYNSDDELVDVVMYRTSKLYEVSAPLTIKNESEVAVNTAISQVWYQLPVSAIDEDLPA